VWTFTTAETNIDAHFFRLAWNSLMLAAITAVIAVALALLLAYSKRLHRSRVIDGSVRIAATGYAVPGTVIAMGALIPFAWFDNTLDNWMRSHFNISTGLLLSGTIFALVFAYTARFLSVSLQSVESGLGKIKPSIDDAGRSLGLNPLGVLKQLHLPIMKGTVLTALLLVFVDVLKELPATLILRPFNFNTLAVRAYEMASDERLADAGAPSLMIVLVGIIPVILLSRAISQSRAGRRSK
jgi:iron(III) transport system permease protein